VYCLIQFVAACRANNLPGDEGEIFRDRIDCLNELRDDLVLRLKQVVNGFMKELKSVHDM
jgi:hypothetical protein